jgi:hypothetical protein
MSPDPVPALEEAKGRLAGLDDLPLDRHPAEFATIDGLLRQALDPADGPAPAAG